MNTEAAEQGVVVGQLVVGVNDLGQAIAELPEQRRHLWGYFALAGAVAALALVKSSMTSVVIHLTVAGLVAGLGIRAPWRRAKALLAGRAEADLDTRIEVHEDRIVLVNAVCRNEISLAACLGGIETKSAFFVYTTAAGGQPLYKRAFGNEADLSAVRRRIQAIPWRKAPARAWIGVVIICVLSVLVTLFVSR
jgi:hypothetical protein